MAEQPDSPLEAVEGRPGRRIPVLGPAGQRPQQVLDPLYETGVRLDPDSPGLLTVSGRIQRGWVLPWGWTGDRLVRLLADAEGSQVVRDGIPDGFLSAQAYQLVTTPSFAVSFDLGHVCYAWQAYCPTAQFYIRVGDDGTTWRADKVASPVVTDPTAAYCGGIVEFHYRGQHVRVISTTMGANSHVRVFGYYPP